MKERSAYNKRFGEIGAEVIIRISLCPLTVGVSPNCVQLTPQLRQAAGTLSASGGQHSGTSKQENRKIISNININLLSAYGGGR